MPTMRPQATRKRHLARLPEAAGLYCPWYCCQSPPRMLRGWAAATAHSRYAYSVMDSTLRGSAQPQTRDLMHVWETSLSCLCCVV